MSNYTVGKTIIRHLPSTARIDDSSTISILPSTRAFAFGKATAYSQGDEFNSDIPLIVRKVLNGNVEYLKKYLNPIKYSFEVEDSINGYKIIRKIGSGSFSKVYEVTHQIRSSKEALKILDPFQGYSNLISRYQLEYQIGQISSKYILRSKDKGFIHGHPFIVSEIADGGDIGNFKLGKLEVSTFNLIAKQVLEGLNAIHKKGIVHRDIKPQNIFLCGDKFKIGDFGVSTVINGDDADQIYGTYGYMAPELFLGDGVSANILQDIFSFGCMMFHVITGVLPFGILKTKDDISHYNYNALNSIFRSVRQYRKDVPSFWEDIIYECIHAEPNKRPQSLDEIIETLNIHDSVFSKSETVFRNSIYENDFIISFSDKNKLLGIEIYAYLKSKGIRVANSKYDFLNRSRDFERSRYHLVIVTQSTDKKFIEEKLLSQGVEGVVVYGESTSIDTIFDISKVICISKKSDLLSLIEGWKIDPENKANKDNTKNDLLELVANHRIVKSINMFLDYLKDNNSSGETLNVLYSISSRYKSLQKDIDKDIHSPEHIRREENKIILGLNSLIFDYFND